MNWELREVILCLPYSGFSLVKHASIPAVHETTSQVVWKFSHVVPQSASGDLTSNPEWLCVYPLGLALYWRFWTSLLPSDCFLIQLKDLMTNDAVNKCSLDSSGFLCSHLSLWNNVAAEADVQMYSHFWVFFLEHLWGSWIGRLRKTWICISELNYLSTELSDCLQSASHEKMSTFTELDSVWTQNVLKHCISIIFCDPSSSVLGVVNIWKCIWPSFF